MNLTAFNITGQAIFCRHCYKKEEAKRALVYHKEVIRIDHVKYKNRVYDMKEVYLWP